MDSNFLTSNFGYRKLRKCNHKSEISGESVSAESMEVVCKYNLDEILTYANDDSETLYWIFDRMWEDWLTLKKKDELLPLSPLPLCARETQIIEKTIENLKTPLGKKTGYIDHYDPTLLFPIPRITSRKEMGYKSNDEIPFSGLDIWNCYEVSYLNEMGKPVYTMIRISYDSHSEYIIESKSMKLYLNSFNQEKISGDILEIIQQDIQRATHAKYVFVSYIDEKAVGPSLWFPTPWYSIDLDTIDTKVEIYDYSPDLLEVKSIDHLISVLPDQSTNDIGWIHYNSGLLKSNCRMSGLPDWATISVYYIPDTQILVASSFLRYLISFRNYREFHEPCCEKITTDLIKILKPRQLIVQLRYTRRGGCDINPLRFYHCSAPNLETIHQSFTYEMRQ